MDQHHDTTQFFAARRQDGWTPELKARFLMVLAEAGNARLSARRCGLSVQSAYVQRRRDPVFARAWMGALVHAQRHGEQVLADRALEGVEEPIFYRGEQVGSRRRYDSRLLLAHLARLDKCVKDEAAVRDAERFDELVALVAGAQVPEALEADADSMPPSRFEHARAAAQAAEDEAECDLPEGDIGDDDEQYEREEAIAAAGDAAFAAAGAEWDAWFDHACAVVDRLPQAAPPPHSREGGNPFPDATPQGEDGRWVPASAGMTNHEGEGEREGEGQACQGAASPGEVAVLDPVNGSTSPSPPMERLTFGGFVFNRPVDQRPSESEAAGHPSETVGAGPEQSGPA